MTLQDILQEAKALSLVDRRELIKLLVDTLVQEKHDSESLHSILELRGLGREIWQGVNVDEYLNQMRDEWDQRP